MNLDEHKKVNEMFYAVKGHLFPEQYSANEMRTVYDSYFKRMWGNNEYCNHIENFEDVWSTRIVWLDHIEEEDMSSVAHLGYD